MSYNWNSHWQGKSPWVHKEPDPGVSYHDIVDGTKISAGSGDDKFIIRAFEGKAVVDGNKGHDILDLGNLNPANYKLIVTHTCGWGDDQRLNGKVVLFDDDGKKIGVLKFSDIEEIDTTPRPNGIVEGTSGDDLIDINFVDYNGDRVDGNDALNIPVVGSNNDIIRAGAGNDTVYGIESFDQIRGGDGDDVLFGGNGNDLMFGDADNDQVNGEEGNDTLQGNEGNDTLDGGTGDDRMFGGIGDDIIIGGDGNDVLYGEGTNRFEGALGADTFVFDGDDGNDQVWDFVSGTDVILLEGYVAGVNDPTFAARGEGTVMTYEDTTVFFQFADVGLNDLLV